MELCGRRTVEPGVFARRCLAVLTLLQLLACGPTEGPSQAPDDEHLAAARGRAVSEVECLRAFAHLYGYVRFFHPTDAAAEASWRELAAQGVAVVRDAATLGELTDRLEAFFEPVAPTLQLWVAGEPSPLVPPVPRARDQLVYWQYEGFPGTPVSLYRPPYDQVRVGATQRSHRRFTEAPMHDARIEAEPIADLRVRLPMVLGVEQARTGGVDRDLPVLDLHELGLTALSADGHVSIDVRQGAVVEVWNVLRHFYPYPDAVTSDWEAILLDALVDAQDDTSREDTDRTLRRLVHAMRDGHGDVGHRRARKHASLPFRLELVEGQGVITATADPERFAVGDVVERIGDVAVLDRVRDLEGLVSGSAQWRRFKAATWEALRGPTGERIDVTLRRAGGRHTVTARYEPFDPPSPLRPEPIARFDDGVFYVDLTRATWDEIEPRIEEIATAPGVIFDVRGYPEHNDAVIDHLLSGPEDALWMHVPRIIAPGGEPVAWRHIGWHRRPREPAIAGRVAFLISAEAISYAESILSYVEAHGLGTLVGERTAGTNGDIVRLDTLAGFHVVFTGMRVTRHDGTPFHLQGVVPDVPAHATIEGLRSGRDEVLEAGLATVQVVAPD
jgi:hypothetical protein